MGMSGLCNRAVCLTYNMADMIGDCRGCTGPVGTGELDEESPTGERGHSPQPRALDCEGKVLRSVWKVEEARLQHCQLKKWFPDCRASLSTLEWLRMKARQGVGIEYRQWYPHDSERLVSTPEWPETHGRTDPSVTVIAFRTDATTVLERLALYEIKKARRSERRN